MAFLLEGGIFLLMGLQLKTLLDADADAGLSAGQALGIGLAAAAVAVAVALRMIFIVPLVAALRRDAARAASAKPKLERLQSRVTDPELSHRFSARRLERLVSWRPNVPGC